MQGFFTLRGDGIILISQYGAVDLPQIRNGMLHQYLSGILESIVHGMGQFHAVLCHADTYAGA